MSMEIKLYGYSFPSASLTNYQMLAGSMPGEHDPHQRFCGAVTPVRLKIAMIFFSAGCPAMAGFST